MAELLRRRVVPSTIIRLSTIERPARASAALRRAVGGRGRVELFFAFDDACSAAAVLDLHGRLAGRSADLVLLPVVERGIEDDPAVADKRLYAIADARRLVRRQGLTLGRTEPLAAAEAAALAAEAMALDEPERLVFCVDALRRLWIDGEDVTGHGDAAGEAGVRANERRMRRLGPYDTPAAVIGRQWYFAHDRAAQIVDRLDRLGWT